MLALRSIAIRLGQLPWAEMAKFRTIVRGGPKGREGYKNSSPPDIDDVSQTVARNCGVKKERHPYCQYGSISFHLSGESRTIDPLSSYLPHLGTLSRTRVKYQHSEESHTLCMRSLSLHWTLSVVSFALIQNGQQTLTLSHYQGPAMGFPM